jgi:hypothetical protein
MRDLPRIIDAVIVAFSAHDGAQKPLIAVIAHRKLRGFRANRDIAGSHIHAFQLLGKIFHLLVFVKYGTIMYKLYGKHGSRDCFASIVSWFS